MGMTKLHHRSKIADLATAFFCLLTMSVMPTPALSANFVDGIDGCDHALAGEIMPGDLQRITERDILRGETLCLHSPGGDVEEGNAIAKWLEGRNIKTVLPAMSECYSSCAIIFMAGSDFEEVYMDRRAMHVTANLGFHAPYMTARGDFSAREIEQSYATALADLAEWMSLGAIVGRGDPGFIPRRVILELLKRGPDELYMVDTVYRAKELNIEILGAPTPDWSVQKLCNACVNLFDGNVRNDVCSTAQEVQRTDTFVDIVFHGVAAEGHASCGIRLEKNVDGSELAKAPYHGFWDGDSFEPDMELRPEMALGSIGH